MEEVAQKGFWKYKILKNIWNLFFKDDKKDFLTESLFFDARDFFCCNFSYYSWLLLLNFQRATNENLIGNILIFFLLGFSSVFFFIFDDFFFDKLLTTKI